MAFGKGTIVVTGGTLLMKMSGTDRWVELEPIEGSEQEFDSAVEKGYATVLHSPDPLYTLAPGSIIEYLGGTVATKSTSIDWEVAGMSGLITSSRLKYMFGDDFEVIKEA